MGKINQPEPDHMYRVYKTKGDIKLADYYIIMPLPGKQAVLYCRRTMKWNEKEKHNSDLDFRKAWCQNLPL